MELQPREEGADEAGRCGPHLARDPHGGEEHGLRLTELPGIDQVLGVERRGRAEDVLAAEIGEEGALCHLRIDREEPRRLGDDRGAIEACSLGGGFSDLARVREEDAPDLRRIDVGLGLERTNIGDKLAETGDELVALRRSVGRGGRPGLVELLAALAHERVRGIEQRRSDDERLGAALAIERAEDELAVLSPRVDEISGKHRARASGRS